jgi:hypothetical protein
VLIFQWAFLDVLLQACADGFLSKGDVLICDNASVHHGADSAPLIDIILNRYG